MIKEKAKIYKPRVIQSRFDGNEVSELELIKKTYGHKSDSTIVRYLVHQVAESIKNGKPHILITQS